MFVYSMRASTLKFFGVVGVALTVLIVLITFVPTYGASASASETVSYNYEKIKTDDDVERFLGQFGWQVGADPHEQEEVTIPETFDKILGLDLGADDYVTKPFDSKEVVARVKAVLRRTGGSDETAEKIVKFDKLTINLTNYELIVDGKQVDTPPKELELIYHLASNPNRVYSRDQLLDEVWGFEYYGDSRTVDVHVKRLREKLEGVSDKWSIKTVWSVGYKFELKQN